MCRGNLECADLSALCSGCDLSRLPFVNRYREKKSGDKSPHSKKAVGPKFISVICEICGLNIRSLPPPGPEKIDVGRARS